MRWPKREEIERTKRRGREREEREGEGAREWGVGGGEKTSAQKMLTFDSPQLSPPVKIGGVRFRGLSLCCTAEKKRWKEKKCH